MSALTKQYRHQGFCFKLLHPKWLMNFAHSSFLSLLSVIIIFQQKTSALKYLNHQVQIRTLSDEECYSHTKIKSILQNETN